MNRKSHDSAASCEIQRLTNQLVRISSITHFIRTCNVKHSAIGLFDLCFALIGSS